MSHTNLPKARATEEKSKIRLSLEVTQELNGTLEELAEEIGGTKSDVLRKAIALMEIAVAAKKQKLHLGLVDQARQVVTTIISL